MDVLNTLTFQLSGETLLFDVSKQTLLCRSGSGGNIWIKKIDGINSVNAVSENETFFFVSCETDDVSGIFLAIDKKNGFTAWDIPGNAYFHLVYSGSIYIIFIDAQQKYFLIRAEILTGKKIWHRIISSDLEHYTFDSDRIVLEYSSGKKETVLMDTGETE